MLGETKALQKERGLIVGGSNVCPHDSISRLGSDGDIVYLKCGNCEAIIAYDFWNGLQENLRSKKTSLRTN